MEVQDSRAIPGANDAMVEALQRAGIDFRSGTPFQNPWGSESDEPPSFLIEIASKRTNLTAFPSRVFRGQAKGVPTIGCSTENPLARLYRATTMPRVSLRT
jgi:hypothetical protein